MNIQQALSQLLAKQNLSATEAEAVMEQIMTGATTPAQIGGFLIALRLKGETVAEVTGFARAMRRNAIGIESQRDLLVDTCGTGGDGTGTFNISTTAAFVVAGGDLAVAKHGNRSVSSKCGSADVLQALGVNLNLTPTQVSASIDEIGIGFLFAPRLHPAMKHAVGPRREMGVRTVFNILGPLTNPARAQIQVIGVYSAELTTMLAHVLGELGTQGAFVVHGADGMDELSTTGPNHVAQLNGKVHNYTFDPLDLGLPRAKLADLTGGDAQENAAITREILRGQNGPKRDIVLLNAAASFVAAGAAKDLAAGIALAANSIDSGKAREKLEQLITFSNSFASA